MTELLEKYKTATLADCKGSLVSLKASPEHSMELTNQGRDNTEEIKFLEERIATIEAKWHGR